MNASLQCLSNLPFFSEYFVSKIYQREINYTNFLGKNS
jgi:hypothetical protein